MPAYCNVCGAEMEDGGPSQCDECAKAIRSTPDAPRKGVYANCPICGHEFRKLRSAKTCSKECSAARIAAYKREYCSRPEVKARKREYHSRPEAKAHQRAYKARPEVKARQREYNSRPEAKAYQRERSSLPEVKARKKKLESTPKYKEHKRNYGAALHAAKRLGIPLALYAAMKLSESANPNSQLRQTGEAQ